jgi:UDP-2-acetamido-3-amino-2,3-dideoxy-glucuronate N-acetyltransferase
MSWKKNLKLRIKYKNVKFYNLSLTEIQEDVEIGEGSRIGSFALIQKDVRIGKNCTIGSFCNISSGVRIGDNVSIQTGCHITRGVQIGSGCFIGPGVITMNDKQMSGTIIPPFIGNNTKIGGGSCILPEVKIGDNILVGAGSVVTKSINNNEKAFGNPARIITK